MLTNWGKTDYLNPNTLQHSQPSFINLIFRHSMTNSAETGAIKGLDAFRIVGLPPDFYYLPNFISVEEEASILQKVNKSLPNTLYSTAPLLTYPAFNVHKLSTPN
jgi:hypothetical protein